MWRSASPASNPVAKLTLLSIPLGHYCPGTLFALMAELTSVGAKGTACTMRQHDIAYSAYRALMLLSLYRMGRPGP